MKAQMRMSVFTEVYAIYEQDTKETFNYEHELGILKDQPRWKEPLNESSSKRSKISSLREGGGYSSSSNLETPTSYEHDSTLGVEIGQTACHGPTTWPG